MFEITPRFLTSVEDRVVVTSRFDDAGFDDAGFDDDVVGVDGVGDGDPRWDEEPPDVDPDLSSDLSPWPASDLLPWPGSDLLPWSWPVSGSGSGSEPVSEPVGEHVVRLLGWTDPGWAADEVVEAGRADPVVPSASVRARQWGRMPVGPVLVDALTLALGEGAPALPYPDLVEALTALERVRAWACGVAAGVRADLLAAREADLAAERQRWGSTLVRGPGSGAFEQVAAEVALAEGVSPATGQRRLGESLALVAVPAVHGLVSAGRVQPEAAAAVVDELDVLDAGQRAGAAVQVVAAAQARAGTSCGVAPGTHPLWDLSPARRRTLARRAVLAVDPAAAARRGEVARAGRCVRLRPGRDGMAGLWGWLPVEAAGACAARLDADARAAAADAAEVRTLDQLRADHLVWRLTDGVLGTRPPSAHDATTTGPGPGRSVTVVHLTIDAATALGLSEHPAQVTTDVHGPRLAPPVLVDAGTGRRLLVEAMARALADPDAVQLHRVLTDPATGVATDVSHRYRPSRTLARFISTRDRGSRFPTSDSPPREHDHVIPFDHTDPARGGPTSAANLEATGQRDHHTRHAPGWHLELLDGDLDGPGAGAATCWVTPAGRRYPSTPPPVGVTDLGPPPF